MLTRIKIEKLFDIFDYDIALKPEGITILTGPNGYGKTTVLRIVDALALANADFFNQLVFDRVVLEFADGNSIDFSKGDQDDLYNAFEKLCPTQPYVSDKAFLYIPNTAFLVYFIREQRLLRWAEDGFEKTIAKYAEELKGVLELSLVHSSLVSQNLDATFPRRLFDQEQGISDAAFKQRFDKVKAILRALAEYGLSDIQEDSHPTYKAENAKALAIYIDDTERKLAVFAELLQKLTLFTGILNERRLTFKRISISKASGFEFTTGQGKPLSLTELSSGEQQEVVLLYELLFKVQPGTLVLIDEPELSLHVVWQKQFLDDLFNIVALQKINIIVATHSPQIINNHWDLTVDLEDLHDAALS